MLHPSDEEYQQSKRLKKSGGSISSPFRELAAWIASSYGVEVLDIHYDIVTRGKLPSLPRLNVILEWMQDKVKFEIGDRFHFDKTKQDSIRVKFESLLAERGNRNFQTDQLFVIFSAFEEVARIEANERVTKDDLERLKQRLANPELWTIDRIFDCVTFFFYTDAQSAASKERGLAEQYSQEYARLVASYDEFGYLARVGVAVYFNSKENFDTNYQSNWHYFYK